MIILFKWLLSDGLALWPFILVKRRTYSKQLIRHERTHLRQQSELLVIVFYVWYIVEFLFRLVQYGNPKKAYRNICFEREAYGNQHDIEYLTTRKHYSFLDYL